MEVRIDSLHKRRLSRACDGLDQQLLESSLGGGGLGDSEGDRL